MSMAKAHSHSYMVHATGLSGHPRWWNSTAGKTVVHGGVGGIGQRYTLQTWSADFPDQVSMAMWIGLGVKPSEDIRRTMTWLWRHDLINWFSITNLSKFHKSNYDKQWLSWQQTHTSKCNTYTNIKTRIFLMMYFQMRHNQHNRIETEA